MNKKINVSEFQFIIENLTPESQKHLLELASMAQIAEKGKENELKQLTRPKQTA